MGHDSEETTDLKKCFEPGCYNKTVKYSASIEQIKALIEISSSCRQFIAVRLIKIHQTITCRERGFYLFSTNAMVHLLNKMEIHMRGGTTEMESLSTFGPAISPATHPTSTSVSVESTATVSIAVLNAIATLCRPRG